MSTKTRRTLSGIGAAVLVLALAVGGTFAYTTREQRSNIVQGRARFQARLVEEFDPNTPWVRDVPINKPVTVRNMGGVEPEFPGSHWGDIFVALQIREHMDLTNINYIYFTGTTTGTEPIRFMVTRSEDGTGGGHFVRLPVGTDVSTVEGLRAAFDWSQVIDNETHREAFLATLPARASSWQRIHSYFDDAEYLYLPTIAGDPNGQYGSFVVVGVQANDARVITGNSVRGQYDTYLNHYFDQCTNATREYAELVLGNDVMWFDDWDGEQNVWVLYITAEHGPIAIWSSPLAPGAETSMLLREILPLRDADEAIHYDVFVYMWAYSRDEIPAYWPELGFVQQPSLRFANSNVRHNLNADGPTRPAPEIVNIQDSDEVTAWTSSNHDVATVNTNTGVVSIVGPGTTTITATITRGDGSTVEISYTLTVVDDTTPLPELSFAQSNVSHDLYIDGPTRPAPGIVNIQDSDEVTAWTSSNTGVATVNTNTGVVTAVGTGTTTITATITRSDGSTVEISYTLTVTDGTPAPLPNLVFNPATRSIGHSADAFSALAMIPGFNATDYTLSAWASSNPAAATVNAGGQVTPVAEGTTNITVLVTPTPGRGNPHTITLAVTVTEDVLPTLPNITFSDHIEENDRANAHFMQFANLFGQTLTFLSGAQNPTALHGHGYVALDQILPASVLNDSAAITVNVISSGIMHNSNRIAEIPQARVRIERDVNIDLNRTGRIVQVRGPHLVIDHLPARAEMQSLASAGQFIEGIYRSEIVVTFTQNGLTSAPVTIPVMWIGALGSL